MTTKNFVNGHRNLEGSEMETNSGWRGRAFKNSGRGVPIWKVFKYADFIDKSLVAFGTLGAIADGMSTPILVIMISKQLNTLGTISPGRSEFLQQINKFSLYIIYLSAATWIAAFLEAFCWTRTSERQASHMRSKYLKAVLRQDVGFFDTQGTMTSEVVTSVSKDTLVIQDALGEKIPNFVSNISLFFSSYTGAFYLTWRLAIVAFPFAILLIIPGIVYGRMLAGIARKMHQSSSVAGNIAEQAISSIRTVFSFVGEERTMARFAEALTGTVKLGLKQGLVKGIAVGSTGVIFCIWAFVSWYGSGLVMYHGEKGGIIFAAGSSLIIGGLGLGTALPNIRYFSEACNAADRIFEMIERVPMIDSDNCNGQILQEVRGEVEFRNVQFAYPSRPETLIFESFSLTITASKTVALVGGSGSGKSTAVALLQRFYDPLGGEILLDGVNIMSLQLKWLRSQMGLVSQEPALFATSIKENILFGTEGATMEQVIAAAQAANAHKFITQFPNGYDTQVGEHGIQMSGGQKQRIAIARAMVRDPRILLLDEATSALDAESEKIVQDALDHASLGRTTLIIAHRLSTIRNADLIAVVQGGQVIESGMHSDLVSKKRGAYSTLVQLQQEATCIDEPVENGSSDPRRSSSVRPRNSSIHSRSDSDISISGNLELKEQKHSSTTPSFWRLMLLNASEWKQALLGCLGGIGFGAVQPIYGFALGSMISVFFLQDHNEMKSKIKMYSLIFFGLGVFSFLVNIVQNYNFAVLGEYLTKRVQERMLSKILTFEVGWFDQEENSSGAICSKIAKEANAVRSLVGDRLSLLIQTTTAVGLAFTMSLIIAWRFAIVMIAVQPLIIICFYSRKALLQIMSAKTIRSQAQGSQMASEAVGNHRTITAFSLQEKILSLFNKTQEGPQRENTKQSWIAGLVLGTSQSANLCMSALSFWYGAHLVHKGYITSRDLFQIHIILMSTGRVIADAGSMTSDIAKGSDAVKSVFSILDRESRINSNEGKGETLTMIEGNISFQKVDFAYPSRPDIMIFKGFSLNIKKGRTLALVGESGSGKSTIVGLIERFYDPLKGTVSIDGRNIRVFNLRSLRQHIALVSQEPNLFTGSIRHNICYGKENATEVEMVEAAKAANAHKFISCLKDGYDTNSGDRGVQLSGGQKQRIAIARAIIKNPTILLLDEATSALDTQSEKVVQEALDKVMVGRTSVVIAHRLSTIQNADSIAVIKDGCVVEQGSHSDLMSKGNNGPYFCLVNMQRCHDSNFRS